MERDISACLIVRDEMVRDEQGRPLIERCLQWLLQFVGPTGEIIVVDTGSEDETAEHAARFPNTKVIRSRKFTLLSDPLDFDFSDARNESLLHATRPWLFWADADDIMGGPELLEWLWFWRSPGFGQAPAYRFAYRMPNGAEYLRLRLFRRDCGIQFRGACHEYLPIPEGTQNMRNLRLIHGPHNKRSIKRHRWLANLLIKESERENRQVPRTQFYLGNQLSACQRWRQAIEAYDQYLLLTEHNGWSEERHRAMGSRGECFDRLGQRQEAIAALEAAIQEDGRFALPRVKLANLYEQANHIERARETYEALAELRFDPNLVLFCQPSLYGAQARHLLDQFNEKHPLPKHRTWEGEKPKSFKKVSVVILHHDDTAIEKTTTAIWGVLANTRSVAFEIILVLNGSKARKHFDTVFGKRIRIVELKQNSGFSGGNNSGAKEATGDVLCFLNSDTVAQRPFIEPMLLSMEKHDAGAVGPRSNFAAGIAQRTQNADTIAEFNEFLSGFCLMVRRDVFEAIGGFDERFKPLYFEDNDICMRIQQAGWDLVCSAAAYVYHDTAIGVKHPQAFAASRNQFDTLWPKAALIAAHKAHHENKGKRINKITVSGAS